MNGYVGDRHRAEAILYEYENGTGELYDTYFLWSIVDIDGNVIDSSVAAPVEVLPNFPSPIPIESDNRIKVPVNLKLNSVVPGYVEEADRYYLELRVTQVGDGACDAHNFYSSHDPNVICSSNDPYGGPSSYADETLLVHATVS